MIKKVYATATLADKHSERNSARNTTQRQNYSRISSVTELKRLLLGH